MTVYSHLTACTRQVRTGAEFQGLLKLFRHAADTCHGRELGDCDARPDDRVPGHCPHILRELQPHRVGTLCKFTLGGHRGSV